MNIDIATVIGSELNISVKSVSETIKLLEDGCTIPFIARYRKEATGMLDEVTIYNIQQRNDALIAFSKRKEYIIASIDKQGRLTAELKAKIEAVDDINTLEDLYLPFKPHRRTRAQIAIERGLEPMARIIMSQTTEAIMEKATRYLNKDVCDTQAVIAGASDIIAEWISENEKARSIIRSRYNRNATIHSKVVKGKENIGQNYQSYFDFREPLRSCSSHRLLAMLRGEKEEFLKVTLHIDDDDAIERLERLFIKSYAPKNIVEIIRQTIKDAFRRLIKPSIETEILNSAKIKADNVAINMFADNVKQLLLSPPLGHKRVMGIDPGYRTGCKVVCLDQQGNLLHNEVIYPNPPQNDFRSSAIKVSRLVESYKIEAIAVGNGTASRETEKFLSSIRYPHKVQVFIVNENGASIYSASKIAREEFPNYDVTVRGAVSIGRRLIDPLAELVKIEPKSIGVGQYQHDVDQSRLKEALTYTVESCVNSVGVNVNTASKELLSYVSGIGPSLAANIVQYRASNGDFKSRQEIMNVPRMGEKAFQQCAGFLRIPDTDNILDNTAVHPEQYALVKSIADDLGLEVQQMIKDSTLLHSIDLKRYITEVAGLPTLNDIISELEKPGRDPRHQIKILEFDDNIKSINDLRQGMILNGIVNNITAFGCFVDIGIKENGLIHISQLCDHFISSPAEVVSLNQHIKVKVIDIDLQRRRIALTLKGL